MLGGRFFINSSASALYGFNHRLCGGFSNATDTFRYEVVVGCCLQVFNRPKMCSQLLCCGLTHFGYTKRKQKPTEGCLLTIFYCLQYVCSFFILNQLKIQQLLFAEAVQITWPVYKVTLEQLINDLFTQTIDIHSLARNEMFQCLAALCSTFKATSALGHSDAIGALHNRITNRTTYR